MAIINKKQKDKTMVKKTKRTPKVAVTESVETISEQIAVKEKEIQKSKKLNLQFVIKLLFLVLIGSGAFLLAQKYRGLLIAGTVNNQPIYRWEIMSRLNDRYAATILEQTSDEVLLMQEVKKNGITVTAQDVQTEFDANVQQYGDKDKLLDAAKQAGYTSEKSIRQLFELKIAIKKLQEKLFKIEVTTDEVKKYFDENKQYLGGKKFEETQKDLTEQLKQQKLQQEFNNWFTKVKNEAQVKSYL